MPSRNVHAIDIVATVPEDAERRRLQSPDGVVVERAMFGGDWQTVALAFPVDDYTMEQAQAWATEHHYDGTVKEGTEPRADAADAVTMETVRHHDSVGILGSPVVRADGTLLVMGRLAKPGILPYHSADGLVRRELVTDSTLRDKDWLKSVARSPVTLEHPVRDGALVDVDPDNVDVFGVGDVDGRVEVDADDYVVLRLAARRRDAIDAIRSNRKVELSPGYDCDLDPTPGIHPVFGEYDAIQVRRRCNHVAITDVARGGHDIAIRRDSALLVQARADHSPTGGTPMDKEKLRLLLVGLGMTEADAKRCDSLDDALTVLKAQRSDGGTVRELYDELSSDFRKVSKDRDTLQGKVDGLEAKLAAMDKKKGDSGDPAKALEAFIAQADERTSLLGLAESKGVEDIDKLKRADNATIRLAVVKKVAPSTPEDATEDYVRGVLATMDAEPETKRQDAADPWAPLSTGSGKFDDQPAEQGTRRDSDPYRVQIANCNTTAADTAR